MKIMHNMLFISLLFLFGCATSSRLATQENFENSTVGITKAELVAKMGKPFNVKKMKDGKEEYHYLEKVQLNNLFVEEKNYFFLINDGRVVSKRIKSEIPTVILPRNSYDLQTTHNK